MPLECPEIGEIIQVPTRLPVSKLVKRDTNGYKLILVDTGNYKVITVAIIDYNMATENYKWLLVDTDG